MPFVQINDIKMYYKIVAGGNETSAIDPSVPTMIVLHGGFGAVDHNLEVKAWTPFSDYVQLVFPDLRGCGKTEDGDPNRWTMDQFGEDIFLLANALKIINPIVGGISSGGYITFSYATQHPTHPRALVLLNTEPVVSPKKKRQAYLLQASRSDKRDFAHFSKLTNTEIVDYANRASKAAYDYDVSPTEESSQRFAELGYRTISKTIYEFIPPSRVNMPMKAKLKNGYKIFDYSRQIKNISCPVIWFAGEWDPLHPCAAAIEGAQNLQDVELHILRAGAPVYQDAPTVFYKKTITFFKKKLGLTPIFMEFN